MPCDVRAPRLRAANFDIGTWNIFTKSCGWTGLFARSSVRFGDGCNAVRRLVGVVDSLDAVVEVVDRPVVAVLLERGDRRAGYGFGVTRGCVGSMLVLICAGVRGCVTVCWPTTLEIFA
jgi:hypothetical protein